MTFTIAHLSDAHLSPAPFPGLREMRLKRFMGYVNWKRGRERLNDMAMLARLVADLRAQRPDHVAMTGDAVNIALAAEFDRAASWMKTLGDPANVSFTPGNHDAYVRDAMEGLARVFAPWTSGDSGAPGVEPFSLLARARRNCADRTEFGRSHRAADGVGPSRPQATGFAGPDAGGYGRPRARARDPDPSPAAFARSFPPVARPRRRTRIRADDRPFRRRGDFAWPRAQADGALSAFVCDAPGRRARSRHRRPSASAATADPRQRAGYYLIRIERSGPHWRVGARERGLLFESSEIGEREAPSI